jgi:hypothetical protein
MGMMKSVAGETWILPSLVFVMPPCCTVNVKMIGFDTYPIMELTNRGSIRSTIFVSSTFVILQSDQAPSLPWLMQALSRNLEGCMEYFIIGNTRNKARLPMSSNLQRKLYVIL